MVILPMNIPLLAIDLWEVMVVALVVMIWFTERNLESSHYSICNLLRTSVNLDRAVLHGFLVMFALGGGSCEHRIMLVLFAV